MVIEPAFKGNKRAIVFELSMKFVACFSVCLIALLEHIKQENKYDIVVLTNELRSDVLRTLIKIVKPYPNVRIRFCNPDAVVAPYIQASRHNYFYMCYWKLAFPDIFSEYSRVLHLGADTLLYRDVHELLETELDENTYMAGVLDMGYSGLVRYGEIPADEIGLDSPEHYVNADNLLFNLDVIRRDFSVADLMAWWEPRHVRFVEQDAFNAIFKGHIKMLDTKWNVFPDRTLVTRPVLNNRPEIVAEWQENIKDPYLVHYASNPKPWVEPTIGMGTDWWEYARKSPYYEVLLRDMIRGQQQ